MRFAVVVVIVQSLMGTAAAAPAVKRSADEARHLKSAIAEAHKASRAGDHAAAMAAFARAAELAPGDAAVLSELGWAAYQAKDAARAEQATRAAIAAAKDYASQRVKAASLY